MSKSKRTPPSKAPSDPEFAAAQARQAREDRCMAEVRAVLKKFGCEISVKQTFLNGRIVGQEIVFIARRGDVGDGNG